MKKITLLFAFIFSIVSIGQTVEPELEIVGNLVKASYYYDNGAIQQEGFFKDGKLEGKWTSYTAEGTIRTVANYKDGIKSGKWIVDTKEVVYNNNEVVSVASYKNALAKN